MIQKSNENFVDATIDGGGHTMAILEKNKPEGKVLGIDLDKTLLENLKFKIKNLHLENRVILVQGNFKNLKEIIKNTCPDWNQKVNGVLFDLGMSSWQLEESGKGFSFKRNEPLDMRFDSSQELTAKDIVNYWPEYEIEKILREYSEERYARKIAKEIVSERQKKPIFTTFELVEVIKKAVPRNYERGRIHPTTRTFQALRIATNQELENLRLVLPQAMEVLKRMDVLLLFLSLIGGSYCQKFLEKAKEEN